jgi:hypothetical protein
VRGWLPWLLVFGVIAGLCGRVLAMDHVHSEPKMEHSCGHDHDHGGHDEEGGGDSHGHDHGHGPDCPPGPHEHHHANSCCHTGALTGDELLRYTILPPGGSRVDVAWHSALKPDEPVFALDKPPLI